MRGRSGKDIVISRKSEFLLLDEGDRVRSRFDVPYGAELNVVEGDMVQPGAVIYRWDPYSDVILSDKNGVVRFGDLHLDVTIGEDRRKDRQDADGRDRGPRQEEPSAHSHHE